MDLRHYSHSMAVVSLVCIWIILSANYGPYEIAPFQCQRNLEKRCKAH